MYHQNYSSL